MYLRTIVALAWGIFVVAPSFGQTTQRPDTLVLCPAPFQDALQRWVRYREGQGHRIQVLTPLRTARQIKSQIAEAVRQSNNHVKNVFIVGDAGDQRAARSNLVPTEYVPAKVNVWFGSSPEIGTDNTYADLDDDGIPELAIGRLPVDSIGDVIRFTRRVIDYETRLNSGSWIRRINCVAGVGGFGQLVDGVIEQTTKQMLTELIPAGYETTMTYGSWTSPYCPDPRRFSEQAIERFNEGCLFWIYIGHGHRDRLDRIRLPDQTHRILDNKTVAKLNCRQGSPIAFFLACYTGAFDYRNDCLVENMIRNEGGPVAVICGTRVTMPYAMSLFSLEILHEYFQGETLTMGEMIRLAKCRMVNGSNNYPFYRQMIDGVGQALSPKSNLLDKERLEHAHLMHLIGDPLMRLKRPDPMVVSHAKQAVSGKPVAVRIDVPYEGDLVVELAYQRDRLKNRMRRRSKYDSSDESFASYQETYDAARDLVTTKKRIHAGVGPVEVMLEPPDDASGACVIRAMLGSDDGFAIGSGSINLKKMR